MSAQEDENKILFLLTYSFPWGEDHEFLEDEINYLSGAFTKIHIFCLVDHVIRIRKLPANVSVTPLPANKSLWRKWYLLLQADWADIWQEFKSISSRYKLQRSKPLLKTALGSYLRALEISNFISKRMKRIHHQKIFMYAFWNDTSALSLAVTQKNFPQITSFSRAHRFEVYTEENKLNYLPFTFFKFNYLNAVFFVSENGRNYTLQKFPFIDERKMKLSRLGTESLPDASIISNEKKMVVFSISYFLAVKRISLIAESLALIDDIEIEWFHIGEGFGDVQSYQEQINHTLKNRKNVSHHFLGNMIKSEINSFLTNHYIDLLINVSSSEGLPVSMMEAMSAGIPVMGIDVGGVAEIVKDGYNGILLPPNPDAAFIASSLRKFYFLPKKEKEKFRQHAFNTWKENYNAAINYPAFIREILSL